MIKEKLFRIIKNTIKNNINNIKKFILLLNKNISLSFLIITTNVYANNTLNINQIKESLNIKRKELLEKNVYFLNKEKKKENIIKQINININYLKYNEVDITLLEHITLLYEKLYNLSKDTKYLTKSYLINKKLYKITKNKKYFINKLRILLYKNNYHKLYKISNNYLENNNYNNIIANYYLNSIILLNYKFKINYDLLKNFNDTRIKEKLSKIKNNIKLETKEKNVFT